MSRATGRPLAVSRRRLLQSAAAASVVGAARPPVARAAPPADRRLLVLSIRGGFVPTLLDPHFGPDGHTPLPGVPADPGTCHRACGALSWSGGPGRPALDRYFRRWSAHTLLLRGLWSDRLDHPGARQAMLAGTAAPGAPELLAHVAAQAGAPFRVYSSSPWPEGSGEASPDRLDPGRTDRDGLLLRALLAAEELAAGAVAAARVEVPGGWDAHDSLATADADADGLFWALDRLLDHLSTTPGPDGMPLLHTVTVAVVGDVARAVRRNHKHGRDHGRTHSVLVAGAGVDGGRVLGATDARGAALAWDPRSGEVVEGTELVGVESVGAGLLAHVGIDPEAVIPGVRPLHYGAAGARHT